MATAQAADPTNPRLFPDIAIETIVMEKKTLTSDWHVHDEVPQKLKAECWPRLLHEAIGLSQTV